MAEVVRDTLEAGAVQLGRTSAMQCYDGVSCSHDSMQIKRLSKQASCSSTVRLLDDNWTLYADGLQIPEKAIASYAARTNTSGTASTNTTLFH